MKLEDQKPFGEMLRAIFAIYGKDYTPALLSIWWAALERFDIADVRRALNAHVASPKNGQFLPKPADVIRHISGDPQTKSLLAWSKVLQAIKSVGCGRTVVFDDPMIHAAIQNMGGWHEFTRLTQDEEPFKAREFQKQYEAAIEHPPKTYPAKLLGNYEISNIAHGYEHTEAPMLVGDPKAAQLVLEKGGEKSSLQITQANQGMNSIKNVLKLVSGANKS